MRPRNSYSIAFSVIMTCACAGTRSTVTDKAARIIALDSEQGIPRQKRIPPQLEKADRFIDADFSSAKLRTYPPETLELLLKSLDAASFYSYGAPRYVSLQGKVFDEAAKRHVETPDDIQKMFQNYLSARMFDKAGSLRLRFPDANLWRVPEVVDSSDKRQLYEVYDISNDSRTATVIHLPIEVGARIVIAAKGGCPVTSRALRTIEKDKDMLRTLQSNGMVVTMNFEPGGVAYFNSTMTAARLYVAHELEDWPGMDFSMSPTFYFLKNGKIVHQFVGWGPNDESLRDFNKGLAMIGLKKS
jgi:hypothetical protein